MVSNDAGLMDFIVVHSGIMLNYAQCLCHKPGEVFRYLLWKIDALMHIHLDVLISWVGVGQSKTECHPLIITGSFSKPPSSFSNHRATPEMVEIPSLSMVTCDPFGGVSD